MSVGREDAMAELLDEMQGFVDRSFAEAGEAVMEAISAGDLQLRWLGGWSGDCGGRSQRDEEEAKEAIHDG